MINCVSLGVWMYSIEESCCLNAESSCVNADIACPAEISPACNSAMICLSTALAAETAGHNFFSSSWLTSGPKRELNRDRKSPATDPTMPIIGTTPETLAIVKPSSAPVVAMPVATAAICKSLGPGGALAPAHFPLEVAYCPPGFRIPAPRAATTCAFHDA